MALGSTKADSKFVSRNTTVATCISSLQNIVSQLKAPDIPHHWWIIPENNDNEIIEDKPSQRDDVNTNINGQYYEHNENKKNGNNHNIQNNGDSNNPF
jgi:hypothetical protein